MKYIADNITGYIIMSRDIEVEIDDAKLEEVLQKETHEGEDWWEDQPADELWIDFESFADHFVPSDEEIEEKSDAIVEEWKALPDYSKIKDCDLQYYDDWNDEPYVKACKQWLQSKGWAPLPYNSDIWFHKK